VRVKKVFWRNSHWMDQPLNDHQAVLDVGAGGYRRAPHVKTMDIREMDHTDVVHNANMIPWPFEDNSFDYVILSNVLEHVNDIPAVLDEIRRISKSGARIRCICPHFTNPCSYVDVTHTHALSVLSLDIFCEAEPHGMDGIHLLTKKLAGCDMGVSDTFRENKFILRRKSIFFREALWWTLVPLWGNVFQEFYEVYASRIIPGWAIYWELETVKPS
jgi:SAM-dependent methyltransferase